MPEALYRQRHWLLLLWLGAFLLFHAPWLTHPTAAFRLNAFDLAEQIGLHPAVRAESPPLRSAGLLRLALPLIASGIAFTGLLFEDARWRWVWRGLALLVALRNIPPEHLLRDPTGLLQSDYGLQLSLLSVLGGLLVLASIPRPLRGWLQARMLSLQIVLAMGAGLLPLLGYQRGWEILEMLGLSLGLGGGLLLYVALLLLIIGICINARRSHNRDRPTLVQPGNR